MVPLLQLKFLHPWTPRHYLLFEILIPKNYEQEKWFHLQRPTLEADCIVAAEESWNVFGTLECWQPASLGFCWKLWVTEQKVYIFRALNKPSQSVWDWILDLFVLTKQFHKSIRWESFLKALAFCSKLPYFKFNEFCKPYIKNKLVQNCLYLFFIGENLRTNFC